MLSALRSVLALVVYVYLVVLVARIVFDLIQSLSREWRPRGAVLVLAEGVYTVTDPPLRALRRVIPPLSIGSLRFDIAFLVLFILVSTVLGFLQRG